MLADCIPSGLHRAISRSLDQHHFYADETCETFKHHSILTANLARTRHPTEDCDYVHSCYPTSTHDDVDAMRATKAKGTPSVSKAGWKPPPPSDSLAYAQRAIRAQRYYSITHRHGDTMERDILAQTRLTVSLHLEPGDSRFLEYHESDNHSRKASNKHNKSWHKHEIHLGPGEGWMMDVWNSPVIAYGDVKYRYVMFFVDISSNFIVDIPLEDLSTISVQKAFYNLISRVKLQFGHRVKLIYCDSFSTFQERRLMEALKIKYGIQIHCFPPHLKWWNQAENIIKIVRNGAVEKLSELRGIPANGKDIIPEKFFHLSIRHTVTVRNQSSSSATQRKVGLLTTPLDHISDGKYPHSPLRPFGARLSYHLPKGGLATTQDGHRHSLYTKGTPGLYMCPADYDPVRGLIGDTKSSVVLVLISGKLVTSADFVESSITSQAQRHAIAKFQGDHSKESSWYVGTIPVSAEAKLLQLCEQLDLGKEDTYSFKGSLELMSSSNRNSSPQNNLAQAILSQLQPISGFDRGAFDSLRCDFNLDTKSHEQDNHGTYNICFAIGNYSGGELKIRQSDSIVKRNIHNRILQYKSNAAHTSEKSHDSTTGPTRRILFELSQQLPHLSNPSEASTFNKYLQIFQFLLCPVGQFPALIALQMYHYRVMNSTVPRLPLNVSALTAQSHHHLIQHLLSHFPASIRNLLKPASIRILLKLKSQKRPPSISLPIQSSATR